MNGCKATDPANTPSYGVITPKSDNGCSEYSICGDSESSGDSRAVQCASCGTAFVADKNRRKFCSHSCYADWRSARTSFVDRFWSKVNKTDACWLWTGATRGGGYGFIAQRRVDGRQLRTMAHRMAWELTHGAVPDGLIACHRCDTPACVNPSHLFLGTQKDNIADALRKGRLVGRNGQVLRSRAFKSHVRECLKEHTAPVRGTSRQLSS